jgi:hypothetical protein
MTHRGSDARLRAAEAQPSPVATCEDYDGVLLAGLAMVMVTIAAASTGYAWWAWHTAYVMHSLH